MTKIKQKNILFSAILLALLFFILPTLGNSSEPILGKETEVVFESDEKLPATLFFVGDIMLGRSVESLMEAKGASYPFTKTKDLIIKPDVSIGNFEGIVPNIHQKTAPMSFKFSIQKKYLEELGHVGFDILSLANNHAYDFGNDGLQHTRNLCIEHGLTCGGDPLEFKNNSFFVDNVGEYTVGYIFLHTLYTNPDMEDLIKKIEEIKSQSDVLVAYVHWGTEYDLKHNKAQEKLAHTLIDSGVDTVVGHHPHVVQDIELYKGKPIFYSLGNFVFDQYFSQDVQEGLGLYMTINEEGITYQTVGFSSVNSKSQPYLMSPKDTVRLLDRVWKGTDQEHGLFTVPLI